MAIDGFEKRKQKTKEMAQRAFVELLNEKPYEHISIREISERAGIGFKTFYRHYTDKTELAQDITRGFVEQVYADFAPMLTREGTLKNLRRVLEVVHENAATVRAIGRAPERDKLVAPVIQQAADAAKEMTPGYPLLTPLEALRRDLMSHHFAHTQLIFFFWWVENEMVVPSDEMLRIVAELVIKPMWTFQNT